MDQPAPVADQLRRLPRPERRAAVGAVVTAAFRTALLMSDGEELSLEANYFELGLTSLRATELKQLLETQLGCEIDAGALFGQPTVERLLAHLTDECLPELFGTRASGTAPQPAAPQPAVAKPFVDQLLARLYAS